MGKDSIFDYIYSCASGAEVKANPTLKKVSQADIKDWSPVCFFEYFTQWKYFKDHVVPATNESLGAVGNTKELTLFELKIFLDIWHPQYNLDEFFLLQKKMSTAKTENMITSWTHQS